MHLEWGPIPDEKEDEMADAIRTNWMCEVLKQKHDKPFFLALGMYSPHYPNYAPRNIFIPSHERGGYAVVNSQWRFIHYPDGAEELYDIRKDPNEWDNLTGDRAFDSIVSTLKASVPPVFAPPATARNELELVIEGESFHWKKKSGE